MKNWILFVLLMVVGPGILAQEHNARDPDMAVFQIDSLVSSTHQAKQKWNGFFKGRQLIAGVYLLQVGDEDRQQPHETDEIYYIVDGKSKFQAGEAVITVAPGSILFVKAGVVHRFFDIEENLQILVLFDR